MADDSERGFFIGDWLIQDCAFAEPHMYIMRNNTGVNRLNRQPPSLEYRRNGKVSCVEINGIECEGMRTIPVALEKSRSFAAGKGFFRDIYLLPNDTIVHNSQNQPP